MTGTTGKADTTGTVELIDTIDMVREGTAFGTAVAGLSIAQRHVAAR